MQRFVVRRVAYSLVVLLIVSFALLFLADLAPGDPAYAVLGEGATKAQIHQVHEDLHLDDPVLSRYGRWVGSLARGDFGDSYKLQRPVFDLVKERLPVTVELIVMALGFALLVSIPIGIYSAYKADRPFDRAWSVTSSTMIAIPPFVIALLLVYVLAIKMQSFPIHFPATGWVPITEDLGQNLTHAILPAATMSTILIAQFTRLLRADMIATLQEDYVLAARARGVPTWRILLRHALRPSLFSLVTLAGVSLGQMVGVAIVVESLFALPGVASLLLESVNSYDVSLTQGIVAFIVVVYTVLNAGVEVAYGFIDPRVRVRGA